MKKSMLLLPIACAVLIGGCATYSFRYDGDPSQYSEYPIASTTAAGREELSAKGYAIDLVKSNKSVSSDTTTMRAEYGYSYEGGEAETAVITKDIYKITFPNTSPTIIKKGEISLSNSAKTIASKIRDSASKDPYITFVRDRKFVFGKHFDAVDSKGRAVVSTLAPTALTATIDGEAVGYIVPGKEPKLIFRNDRELPSELYYLSLVVYASYILQ